MANASRWSLSARQGIPIGALITAGLFVVCWLLSWAVYRWGGLDTVEVGAAASPPRCD